MGASSVEQHQDLAQRFHELAIPWLAMTRFRSNTRVLRNHVVYRELIALGEPIIPLILAEVKREPRVSWFLVLGGITGEDPVPPALAGRVDAMTEEWLGRWTSKLGPDEDIIHRTPQALVSDLYGQVRGLMKRVTKPR